MRTVIFALLLREMKARFYRNRLGAFWFIFEPLAHVAVLVTIFTLIRRHVPYGPPLPVFFISGVIPFLLFKNIALKGMEAIPANKALFAYKQIKPIDTILARMLMESALMACVYALIAFALAFWGGYDVSIHNPLRWGMVFLVGILFALSLALIFTVIGQSMPELKGFIKLAFLPLYFLSCVVMPIWVVPKSLLSWLTWNPFLHLIAEIRVAAFPHFPTVREVNMYYPTSVTLLTLFVGVMLFKARRDRLLAI